MSTAPRDGRATEARRAIACARSKATSSVTTPVTDETADVARLLAPIEPRQILCIGLNYRRHAAETGAKIPEYPILFFKGVNAAQNPGDPIVLPRATWRATRSITSASWPS